MNNHLFIPRGDFNWMVDNLKTSLPDSNHKGNLENLRNNLDVTKKKNEEEKCVNSFKV